MIKEGKNKGKRYQAEKKSYKDKVTGKEIWQMTDYPADHNVFYITKCSFSKDSKTIYFCSTRESGFWNLFKADIASGEIIQLTDHKLTNSPYVPCPSWDGRWIYYSHREDADGDTLMRVDPATLETEVIKKYVGWKLSSVITVLPGDKQILIPMYKTGMKDYSEYTDNIKRFLIVSLEDPEIEVTVLEVPWVLGSSLYPNSKGIMVYCRFDQGELWRINIDGSDNRLLYGYLWDVWITHPVVLNDDEVIFIEWPKLLRKINIEGEVTTIAQNNAFHPSVSPNKTKIVFDTACPDTGIHILDLKTGKTEHICEIGNKFFGEQWKEKRPYPMLHQAPFGIPPSHAHPSFSPDGSMIIFNKAKTGSDGTCRQIHIARV